MQEQFFKGAIHDPALGLLIQELIVDMEFSNFAGKISDILHYVPMISSKMWILHI